MKPLAMTLGDPAGIGPEVMAKVLAARTFDTPITLIGARWALEKGAAAAGVELPEIPAVATADLQTTPIALIDVAESLPAATETQFEFGKVDAGCGLLAVRLSLIHISEPTRPY